MHAFLEVDMGEKPALRPKAAIGPAVRAIAAGILAGAHAVISDPERTSQDAVHEFRRAMKQWRALMRLLAAFHSRCGALAPGSARPCAIAVAGARRPVGAQRFRRPCQERHGAVGALNRNHPRPDRSDPRQRRADGADAGIARHASSPGSTPPRPRSSSGRSIRSTSVRSPSNWRKATAKRGGAFRTTGRRQAPRICTSCASAWSIIAIRWNWSSRYGRGTAGCGPKRPSGCATGSGDARIWKYSNASPSRISPWRIGARG